MTFDIILVLAILGLSIILFAWEKVGPDVVAMLVLITLALTQLVSAQEAFSGFSNPAVITVWAIYIISEGLFKTGVADYLGKQIIKIAGTKESKLTATIMVAVGFMSAFMNNIGATAVFLPAIMGISKQKKVSPSKLLIPLSFASLMGGNMTLIGTPPNILASAILQENTHLSFQFFDFLPTGLLILGSGVLFMTFIGRHLLPSSPVKDNLTQSYHLRDYAAELIVLPDSSLVGKTILESGLGKDYDLTLVSKLNNPDPIKLSPGLSSTRRLRGHGIPVQKTENIAANDIFLVKGSLDSLLKIKDAHGLKIKADITLSDKTLRSGSLSMAEVLVTPSSSLLDMSLKEAKFRDHFNLSVLAVWRAGHSLRQKLADIPIQVGDVLLVQGAKEHLGLVYEDPGLLLLDPVISPKKNTKQAPLSLIIMVGMLISVTTGWLHISVAAVVAAVLMVLARILSMDEAYRAIQWRSIFLIAGMLPLGIAMQNTGAAQFLADTVIKLTGQWGNLGVMLGLYVLTMLLTQPMSNAAATVLVTPIAIDAAFKLGVHPQAYVMAVVIAASTAFLTPIGHQANVLVYGIGNYKFFDFFKVGLGLTLLYVVIVALVLPILWPF